jgi:hypothetical protein
MSVLRPVSRRIAFVGRAQSGGSAPPVFVSAGTCAASAAFHDAVVGRGSTVFAPLSVAAAETLQPAVVTIGGATALAAALTVDAASLQPALSLGCKLAATNLSAAASLPQPNVQSGINAKLKPTTSAAVAGLLNPQIRVGKQVGAPLSTASTSLLQPAVYSSMNREVNVAAAASASATLLQPTAGMPMQPSAITATASVLAPTVRGSALLGQRAWNGDFEIRGTGNATRFNAASAQFLELAAVPEILRIGNQPFYIGFWYYPLSVTAIRYQLARFIASGVGRSFGIRNEASGAVRLQISANGTSVTNLDSVELLYPNQWFYLAAWYDGASVFLAVNNTAAVSAPHSGGVFAANESPLRVGTASGAGNFANGSIAALHIYAGRSLTRSERLLHFNRGTPRRYEQVEESERQNLVGYWNLDGVEGSGLDARGNFHFTSVNGPAAIQGVEPQRGWFAASSSASTNAFAFESQIQLVVGSSAHALSVFQPNALEIGREYEFFVRARGTTTGAAPQLTVGGVEINLSPDFANYTGQFTAASTTLEFGKSNSGGAAIWVDSLQVNPSANRLASTGEVFAPAAATGCKVNAAVCSAAAELLLPVIGLGRPVEVPPLGATSEILPPIVKTSTLSEVVTGSASATFHHPLSFGSAIVLASTASATVAALQPSVQRGATVAAAACAAQATVLEAEVNLSTRVLPSTLNASVRVLPSVVGSSRNSILAASPIRAAASMPSANVRISRVETTFPLRATVRLGDRVAGEGALSSALALTAPMEERT